MISVLPRSYEGESEGSHGERLEPRVSAGSADLSFVLVTVFGRLGAAFDSGLCG
jgi:hypothetical protein